MKSRKIKQFFWAIIGSGCKVFDFFVGLGELSACRCLYADWNDPIRGKIDDAGEICWNYIFAGLKQKGDQ